MKSLIDVSNDMLLEMYRYSRRSKPENPVEALWFQVYRLQAERVLRERKLRIVWDSHRRDWFTEALTHQDAILRQGKGKDEGIHHPIT